MNLSAYQSLQNLKNKRIKKWHFRMLNDSSRNLSFKKAIRDCGKNGDKLDLIDIGAGTGLLSLYASNVDFIENIYAIECDSLMSQISAEVFKANKNSQNIKLIRKHSTDVEAGDGYDIKTKVSVVVSETFDVGVFGEGILETLIHAKRNLLEPDGKIIPWKVKLHVTGFQSTTLCTNQMIINETLKEYLFLGELQLVARHVEPYDSEYADQICDFKLITSTVSPMEVDFNNENQMQMYFDGSIVKKFEIESRVEESQLLDGFVVWFTLFLSESDPENFISTKPTSQSCWGQAIFKLSERVLIEKDQIMDLSISCKNGILEIHHDLDQNPATERIEVDPEVLKFLNDEDYLRELEFAVSKHGNKFNNCLDLLPFPYIGMMLLKESRLDKLWCSKKQETLIRLIAKKNVIDEKHFVFLHDAEIDLAITFELIILHPFCPQGDLDNELIYKYPKYNHQLTAAGLMIPSKITLYGEVVNSSWLVDSCRITEEEVKKLKIDKFTHKFSTHNHLELDDALICEKLSSVFKISSLYFDEGHHESNVTAPLQNTNLPIHAILFHHKIQLSPKVQEFSTISKSPYSSFKRSAYVFEEEIAKRANAKILFTQNHGIVKCDIALESWSSP